MTTVASTVASELIADIRAAGLTQREIADRIGRAQNTVSLLATGKRGSRPSADVLDGLRALHAEVCGNRTAEAAP